MKTCAGPRFVELRYLWDLFLGRFERNTWMSQEVRINVLSMGCNPIHPMN